LQLRVAAGERLPLSQTDVAFQGHAIEARLIAEDPLAGWVPSSGKVEHFAAPEAVRVDTWLTDGTQVPPYYDSLLAKIIAHAATRDGAIDRLARALAHTRVVGIKDNVDLLLATIESSGFRAGALHTGFLDEHRVVDSLTELPPPVLAAASALDFLLPPRTRDPWRAQTAWRIGRLDQPADWSRAGRRHTASVSSEPGDQSVGVVVGERCLSARLVGGSALGPHRLQVDDDLVSVEDAGSSRRIVHWQERTFRLERTPAPTVEETAADRGIGGGAGRLSAPMPARVVRVAVQPGQHVVQNQPLVVLEAMKMEHVVEAPHAGVVSEVCVEVGEQVTSGARLLTLGSEDEVQGAVQDQVQDVE
jgi:3-methylcrotonyl-CoA carboxylase alpha subunit